MPSQPVAPPVLAGLAPLVPEHDLMFCDVWGVVHNGVAAFPEAIDALQRARAGGATVVLLSNAPRPGAIIAEQIERLGVPRSAYDAVIGSGDVTREELKPRQGARIFHLGPARDHPNYDGLDITLAELAQAELVVCTGLFDDTTETPDDYRDLLADMRARNLTMICANPDIVVDRGGTLVWCAGALAQRYQAIEGEVLYTGKPYPAIYRLALERARHLRGAAPAEQRVLAIGDGLHTDIEGAQACGFRTLFVAGGIHALEAGRDQAADADREWLAQLFAESGVVPDAVISRLAW